MKQKILELGNPNSIHLWRWQNFLKELGYETDTLSFVKKTEQHIDYSIFGDYFEVLEDSKGLLKNIIYSFVKFLRFLRIDKIFPVHLFTSFYSFLKVYQLHRQKNYQFIEFHFIDGHFMFVALLVSIFTKTKVILNCWGSDILKFYDILKFGISKLLFDTTLRRSHIITYDSIPVETSIQKKCKNLSLEKMFRISWGIDVNLFAPATKNEKQKLREEYKIPTEAIVILSIRHLFERYGVKDIIKWFKKSITSQSIYLFVRISPLSEHNYIEECKNLSEGINNIIFDDRPVHYFEINKFYKLADINIHFPTTDSRPISVFEAIASENLIIGNQDLEGHQKFKDLYDIYLTSLIQLNEKEILELMNDKEKIVKKNRKVLLKNETDEITEKKIKTMLSFE